VSRDPEGEDVPPQDHEVAVDVVPLAVVGLEHRQREQHRLAEDEQQSPRRHDHDGRGQHELREARLRRRLAEQPAVPHDTAQPVAGPQQAPDDVEDDAAASGSAAAGLVAVAVPVAVAVAVPIAVPVPVRGAAAPGPRRLLTHDRHRRPGQVRRNRRAHTARWSTGRDGRSGLIATRSRRDR
jgi:hypothetical protein